MKRTSRVGGLLHYAYVRSTARVDRRFFSQQETVEGSVSPRNADAVFHSPTDGAHATLVRCQGTRCARQQANVKDKQKHEQKQTQNFAITATLNITGVTMNDNQEKAIGQT